MICLCPGNKHNCTWLRAVLLPAVNREKGVVPLDTIKSDSKELFLLQNSCGNGIFCPVGQERCICPWVFPVFLDRCSQWKHLVTDPQQYYVLGSYPHLDCIRRGFAQSLHKHNSRNICMRYTKQVITRRQTLAYAAMGSISKEGITPHLH